jgi:hypothetical protein
LTLNSTDFRVEVATFRGIALCGVAFAATRDFETVAFFFVATLPLAIIFLVGLLFNGAFGFALFRATVFWATALFALGRLVFAFSLRRLAADLGEER